MLKIRGGCDEHDEFKELCALAASGSLEPSELPELKAHLKHCEKCREVFRQYQILTTQGMTLLADAYPERQAQVSWNAASVRERLLECVRGDQQAARERVSQAPAWVPPAIVRRTAWSSFARMALAPLRLGRLRGERHEERNHPDRVHRHEHRQKRQPELLHSFSFRGERHGIHYSRGTRREINHGRPPELTLSAAIR